jgi:hypothetical protein
MAQVEERLELREGVVRSGARSRRPAMAVALGLASFLAASACISLGYRLAAGPPYIAVMSEKFEDYAAHADDYELVFLGSSQTFRHIDPSVVDAELRMCEAGVRSYNFGVPALREPELRYAAEFLIAHKSDALAYVVIQDPIRADGMISNLMSDRGRYFRGWDRLDDAGRDVMCYTGTGAGQARRAWVNLRAALAEQLGLGRLAQSLIPTPRSSGLGGYDPRYRTANGFWPADQDVVERAASVAEQTAMTADVIDQALTDGGHAPSPAAATCRASQLRETVRKLQGEGIKVLYLVSPNPREVAHDRAVTEAFARLAPDVPILDYNDPAAHPEYFEMERWFDVSHLNGESARALSADIGRRLCAFVKSEG